MIDVRPFNTLGGANHGWLDAKHHFSFAGYHDPKRMGWGALRVWNDDTIAADSGFPPHPHADMEIITYVREGAITHEDNQGNRGRTEAGDVQVMSAGTGIRHSEYNRERGETQIFQIWIIPNARGGKPNWGAKPFPKDDRSGKFVTLASGTKRPERSDLGNGLAPQDGSPPLPSGSIQIWNSVVGTGSRFNSAWRMPEPALITCTSPASVRPLWPRLSSCVMAP